MAEETTVTFKLSEINQLLEEWAGHPLKNSIQYWATLKNLTDTKLREQAENQKIEEEKKN